MSPGPRRLKVQHVVDDMLDLDRADSIPRRSTEVFEFVIISIEGVLTLGHSLDIAPVGISKLELIRHLPEMLTPREVLCIGDRGRWPGTDWQLLNREFSLSVDEVSSALDRGWNLPRPECHCACRIVISNSPILAP